jgi:iron-sulfur cluster assembly protein
MITITPNVAEQILSQPDQDKTESLFLRIAVKQDDSGAFEYGIGFDEATDSDIKFESEGISLIISSQNQELLQGMTIDYVEIEPEKYHFIFLNPNDPNYIPPTDKMDS